MIGDRVRITRPDGRTITGVQISIDDATWEPARDGHGFLYVVTIQHRPQWPSMKNQAKLFAGDDGNWYAEDGQQITWELIEPGPEPAANPGLHLVKPA